MAKGIGDLGQIVDNFKKSISQIFGTGKRSISYWYKGGSKETLFDPKFGGSLELDTKKWVGNTKQKGDASVVRYGFSSLTSKTINNPNFASVNSDTYYLDIPPQAITQKEIFSNTITSTRKGIIVETEGVVFKDIIIRGTTGVFPGQRGQSNIPQPADWNQMASTAPKNPAGVDDDGYSLDRTIRKISGYEEFLRLRQFFLRYSREKVDSNGDKFLVFINEKDDQYLIVEPMEFTMDRSAKSPMTYNYIIVLKCIGTVTEIVRADVVPDDKVGLLQKIGNVSANIQARIQQGRATIAASTTLLTGISQAIDGTFIGPLRQMQYACQDLSEGLTTVLSLPKILINNASAAVLGAAEAIRNAGSALRNFSVSFNKGDISAFNKKKIKEGQFSNTEYNYQKNIADEVASNAREPLPRSFVENIKNETANLSNQVADSINMSSPLYNQITGHVQTIVPDPLRTPSDDEIILLGTLNDLQSALNQGLASNVLYAVDADIYYNQAQQQYKGLLDIPKPAAAREIRIVRGDTLERIAQRELRDATRWLEIVVLNNLKAPYISDVRSDGVKIPGDSILIPEL